MARIAPTLATSTLFKRVDAVVDQRASGRYFTTIPLEAGDPLLQEIFALRYQVLCVERNLLPAALYPDGLQVDEFDDKAVHLATLTRRGTVVASARVLRGHIDALPITFWCQIDAGATLDIANDVAEVSHIVFSRTVRARKADGQHGDCSIDSCDAKTCPARGLSHVAISLYQGIYDVVRAMSCSHLVSALEQKCIDILAHQRVPLNAIGSLSEYIGTSTPHVLMLDELDRALLAHRPNIAARFLAGQGRQRAVPAHARLTRSHFKLSN